MHDSVSRLLDKYPEAKSVGVESPPYGELWSEGLYGLFLYVTEAIYLQRRDVVFFDPLTVKLQAKMDPSVRRGTMNKSDMIEAAKVDTGIKRWNHNEADAFIIARSAARFWAFQKGELQENELTPSERHSFARTPGLKSKKTQKLGLIFREDDRFFRFSLIPDTSVRPHVSCKINN